MRAKVQISARLRRFVLGVLSLAAVALAAVPPAAAQQSRYLQMPTDFEQVDFYLITIGRGPQPHARYGHTIVRVVDRVSGADNSFNWGIFDFADPGFVFKVYRGDMRYMLGVLPTGESLLHYRNFEQRNYVQQKLNLTTRQKRVLMERFLENARPENVYFQYSMFFDNCATRVRDHLDAALGGALRRHLMKPGEGRFRDDIRHGASGSWWIYLGLDFLSNSMLDRPVSKWEEMFLPANVQRHLATLPAFDDDGRPIGGVGLLGHEETLVARLEPAPGADPYHVVGLIFGALAAVGVLSALRGRGRLFGVAMSAFGLWSTVWGSTMAVNWLVSNHAELQHNANLLLFWPLDVAFVGLGWRLARRGLSGVEGRWSTRLAAAHLICLTLLAAGWSTGLVAQDVLPALAAYAPASLLIYGTWLTRARFATAAPVAAETIADATVSGVSKAVIPPDAAVTKEATAP